MLPLAGFCLPFFRCKAATPWNWFQLSLGHLCYYPVVWLGTVPLSIQLLLTCFFPALAPEGSWPPASPHRRFTRVLCVLARFFPPVPFREAVVPQCFGQILVSHSISPACHHVTQNILSRPMRVTSVSFLFFADIPSAEPNVSPSPTYPGPIDGLIFRHSDASFSGNFFSDGSFFLARLDARRRCRQALRQLRVSPQAVPLFR